MRIGLLGPARGDDEALRDAIEFLLGDVEVERAIYLGEDVDVLDAALAAWAREGFGHDGGAEDAFLACGAEVAATGSGAEIRALLEHDSWVRKLARVHKLPPPPARAVEMLADRIMIAVHDKAVLDEEDIANAQIIVYGNAEEAQLKRFGNRYFLTPGPLGARRVAVLETEEDGEVSIALFETSGVPVWRETMARRSGKVSVLS